MHNIAIIQELDIQIIEASDGDEAVSFYIQEPSAIQLILMDLNMVRVQGDEAAS